MIIGAHASNYVELTTMITPVILSGGAGSRLWPMSRDARPKQFLSLTAAQTMFQLTALRTHSPERFAPPMIVAGARHGDLVQQQLATIGVAPSAIILEPAPRNTAPAIALAALVAGPRDILLVMPSDHIIVDEGAFSKAIDAALPFAEDGWLITFGIAPTGPETGYGYIAQGENLAPGVNAVARFVEKPDAVKAKAMVDVGDHVWNAGIFLFRASAFLGNLATHAPAILLAARASLAKAGRSGVVIKPDSSAFAACPSDSIDYAVMEKAARVAVVPVSMGWSDIGSWDALHAHGEKDDNGNVTAGEIVLIDSVNCLVQSDGPRISVSGVEDLIIIASGDDVMILKRGDSQSVKKIVEAVKDQARS